jgi:hypothetical protein
MPDINIYGLAKNRENNLILLNYRASVTTAMQISMCDFTQVKVTRSNT